MAIGHRSSKYNFEVENNDNPDEVTKAIGHCGRWQFKIFMIISWTGMVNAWHMMIISFYAPNANHWCRPPEIFRNWSVEAWKNYSIPPDDFNRKEFSRCEMYDRDYSVLPSSETSFANLSTVPCQYGWDFDKSQFVRTIENEWTLVCNREALAKTGASAYYGGVLAGVLVFGQISDLIGRKKCLMLTTLTTVTAGIATAFVPTLESFFITRFFVAMGGIGGYTTAFVLSLELVDGKYRTLFGIGKVFHWCIGYISLTAIGYFITSWRIIQLCLSVPVIAFFSFWWLIPESPRWLISRGRHDEAHQILQHAAKVNGRKPLQHVITSRGNDAKTQVTMIAVFRSPILRYRTFNLYFNWFVIAFVYYGLISGTSSLGGNIIINYFISGAIEIPALCLCLWILIKKGRRIPHAAFLIVGGVTCLGSAIFEKGAYPYDWPIVALCMIGKFGIAGAFAVIYVYSAELFPTVVRNAGVGTSSLFARIGSICGPYVDLARHVHPSIPLVTYGAFSVTAGLLTLLLPETNKEHLPETIEEAETLGRKS